MKHPIIKADEEHVRIHDVCSHYPFGIPFELERSHAADCHPKIVVVGEAGGRNEHRKRQPFVGKTGQLWEQELLAKVGLTRKELYITNVLWFRPRANNLRNVTPSEFSRGISRVRSKLALLYPNVTVPMGNLALSATTNLKGIMKWRGSRLSSNPSIINTKTSLKVIPTIHPAAALRQPMLLKTMLWDWQKISSESSTPQVVLPKYYLLPVPSNDGRLKSLLGSSEVIWCDIETVKGTSKILCVAFCHTANLALSVDCRKGIPEIVKRILESDAPKGFQNGAFDCYVLRVNGVRVRNFTHDTSLMFHALDNNVGPQTSKSEGKSTIKPYSLGYMASVFSPFPYWKESAKDDNTGENFGAWKSNWRRFQEYNCMDALGTGWIGRELESRLRAAGRWDFYLTQYATLIYPLLRLSLHGVRFDRNSAANYSTTLSAELNSLRTSLTTLAKQPLHAVKVYKREPKIKENRKDGMRILAPVDSRRVLGIDAWVGEKSSLSATVIQRFLYDKLHLPKQRGKKGSLTADELAIKRCIIWEKENKSREAVLSILTKILRFREVEKTGHFLTASHLDSDSRLRCSYSQLAQTGRLRSARNPLGTGMNLQNIQRDVRHFFIPDKPSWLFLELDLKQAEDLVVKAMTGNAHAIALVKDVWSGAVDIHKRMAAKIFHLPPEEVDYEKRQVSKVARHARNNAMGYATLQNTLLKAGFIFGLEECKAIIRGVDEADPWVPNLHRAIRQCIMRHREIATSWGWRLNFEHERLTDPSVFRRGYAFTQQSEIGVLMKQWGLLVVDAYIRKHSLQSRPNLLVHDNIVLSCPIDELWDVASVFYKSVTREREYALRSAPGAVFQPGASIGIPAEIKISKVLSCTCQECKQRGRKALEFGSLPATKKEFYEKVNQWLSTAAATKVGS